ncbi:myosin-cross-reactive antigen family protein [Grosmannia clavigera kw1407]|uniref:Myosin-cross-reactive antigen family protein n=1 Tax=Grosmannia clavigera (strain kw1407 / UAMH 11150) TaxID=655863 RepID=F0XU27_GROCL|nr:myosin-cross-reactive antigen family protein [Grosmannia clavigera kw1407]EFW98415.1 myosin-cross-reactive antigen family protein [Grosmannia clavigera kw1407]
MTRRDPKQTNAYLVGGGIASLTAAVHLYYDAGVPATQIHIIEAAPVPGGSMGQSSGTDDDTWKSGYVILAARKLNFSYRCLFDTLAKVPSMRNPGLTVLDDVRGIIDEDDDLVEVRAADANADAAADATADAARAARRRTRTNHNIDHNIAPYSSHDDDRKSASSFPARLVASGPDGPEIVDVQKMGLRSEEKLGLLGLILEQEDCIGDGQIQTHFKPEFFESKFWDVWASLYGFQPWHSAVEFRRYLLRFLHEFSHISTLEGIDHAPLNDYECIIQPLGQHLKSLGVDFQSDQRAETQVCEVKFAPGDKVHVSELRIKRRADATDSAIVIGDADIVLITLGTMTASMRFGTDSKPPPPLPSQEAVNADPGPVWRFWASLADPNKNPHHAEFGRPKHFYGHISKSSWLSFTITLAGTATSVFDHLREWAGFESPERPEKPDRAEKAGPGHAASISGDSSSDKDSFSNSNGPLITFRDSPWMMSITMPHQPYFTGQPDDVCVLWGYGLYPDQEGLFVQKPMMACTGAEIFSELLAYLNIPAPQLWQGSGSDPMATTGSVTTIPCLMPFIGAPFLTRTDGDRPRILPKSSDNLGLLGQFVEMERDVTFTMEYSARSAQTAVYSLMGLDKKAPEVHRGDRDVQVLGKMLMTIMS